MSSIVCIPCFVLRNLVHEYRLSKPQKQIYQFISNLTATLTVGGWRMGDIEKQCSMLYIGSGTGKCGRESREEAFVK